MKYNKKRLYLALLFFMIISISIGYAFLTNKLEIKGISGIKENSWIIYFDNVIERENNVVPIDDATITNYEKTQIDFSVDLQKPGDKYEFVVDIKNDGSIDAMIDSLEKLGITEENQKYLEFEVTYLDGTELKRCDLLKANSKRKAKVITRFKKDIDEDELPEREQSELNLSFSIHYVQAELCDGEPPTPPPDKYTLYIDPGMGDYKATNGETYNEVTGLYEKVLSPDEIFTLSDIDEPDYYDFIKWNPINNDSYITHYNENDNTITMDENDAYIKAIFEVEPEYVARINDVYYKSIQLAFDDAVEGDMIYLLKNTIESPTNYKNEDITLNLDGYHVEGTLYNTGKLRLVNLNTESESYFINENGYGMVNDGEFTLGYNDGDVDIKGIALIGKPTLGGIGLKNNNIFNFYDGYLEGYIGLDGMFDDIPDNYYVFVDHNDTKNCQKVYLITRPDRAIAKTVEEGRTVFYFHLQDALIQSMERGLVVYAIRDFESPYALNVYENKTAVFDITGFEIETGYTITNDGTFTILDSQSKKGNIKVSVSIENNGDLILDGIEIKGTTDRDVILNNGNLDITASTIEAKGGYAINVATGDHLYMDEDTYLRSDNFALYCNSSDEFTVKGGHIGGIHNTGDLVVEETTHIDIITVDDDTYGIKNDSAVAIVTLNKVDFNIKNSGPNTYAIYNTNKKSEVIINGGNYNIESTYKTGILNTEKGANIVYSGKVTINDGNLKVTNNEGPAKGFFATEELTINGGTIEIIGKDVAVISSANAVVNGGTLIANGTNSAYNYYVHEITGKTLTVGGDATVESNKICIYIRDGITTIDGGNFTCNTYFLEGSNYTWSNYISTSYNAKLYGTLNINGGTIYAGIYGVWGRGQLNMTGGDLTAVENGIEVYNFSSINYSGDILMTGGSITSENAYGIHATKDSVTMEFGGNTDPSIHPSVTGNITGIYSEAAGVTFKDGTALGKTAYGIYVSGDTIIGSSGGDLSLTNPDIRGLFYGLYINNNSYVDFYDGILKGKTHGYYGIITGTEDGTQIYHEGSEIIKGETYETNYLEPQDNFVKVGTVEFNSLQKAIDYINTLPTKTGTIEVLKEHSVKHETTVHENLNVTIDFAGYNIYMTKPLTNNSNLTLTTSIENQDAGISSNVTHPFINNGTLTIDSGKYDTLQGMLIQNKKDLIINGGSLINTSTSNYSYGIYNDQQKDNIVTTTINGGTITVSGTGELTYGIYNGHFKEGKVDNYAATNITGGTITVTSTFGNNKDIYNNFGALGIYGGNITIDDGNISVQNNFGISKALSEANNIIVNGGNITALGSKATNIYVSETTTNGGTFFTNGNCVYMDDKPLTVNDGTFNCDINFAYGSDKLYNYNGFDNITIHGGNITTGNYGIYGYGNITMDGGTITSTKNTIQFYSDKYESSFTMDGGKLISNTESTIYSINDKNIINIGQTGGNSYLEGAIDGIYLQAGTLNIDRAEVIGRTEYGVYTNGITTFGKDEGNISITIPSVRGYEYGVYINEGSITNINDGIYKGTKYGYNGFISGFPDAATITEGEDYINSIHFYTNYLIAQEYFLRVDDQYFNSLQLAIDYITTSNTIYVIADHAVKTETILPAGKDITLEFDGHTLLSSKSLINYGKLTLEDNGENEFKKGGIAVSPLAPISKIIDNKGELIINGGNYHGLTEIVIYNEGIMEFNDGVIFNNSNSNTTYGIYNDITKEEITQFTMTGGTITVTGSGEFTYGIYNNAQTINRVLYTPEVVIDNGTINVTSNYDDDRNKRLYDQIGANGIYGGNNTINNVTMTIKNDLGSSRAINNTLLTTINDGIIITNGDLTANSVSSNLTINGGTLESNGTTVAYTTYNYDKYRLETNINNNPTISSTNVCLNLNDGITNINGGTFTCETIGIYGYANSSYGGRYLLGELNITGGTINSGTYGIEGRGTLNISDVTINSTSHGIYLDVTNYDSTLTMTGGTIDSEEGYGIYSKYSGNNLIIGALPTTTPGREPYIHGTINGIYLEDGTLQLGYKDNKVNLMSFNVVGGNYGIYNEMAGKVYFYDGILKGFIKGYYGTINEIENGTYTHEETEIINNLNYTINYLIREIDVVINTRTNVLYNDLELAFNETIPGDVLKLIDDVQLYYDINIPSNVRASLDWNGHNLVSTRTITNNGNVTMYDSSTNKTSYAQTSLSINLIVNNGTLNISDIDFNNYLTGATKVILNNSSGNLTLTNSTIESDNNIENNGTLTLNNCDLIAGNTALLENGSTTMNNGSITSEQYGIYSTSSGSSTISNVEITSNNVNIYKYKGTSTLTINDSTLSLGYINNLSGTLEINGGTIDNYIRNSATTIIDGTYISDSCFEHAMTGYDYTSIENKGTLTINNATYEMNSSNNGNFIMLQNTGTFNSNNTTYYINRTIGDRVCWWSGYSTTCRELYIYAIKGTGDIHSSDSTYTIIDTSNSKNNKTHYYGFETTGNSTIETNGDTINITNGMIAYGINSLNKSVDNIMIDTTINLKDQPTQYDMYLENGTYLTRGNDFQSTGGKEAYGLYAKTGMYTMETGNIEVIARETAYGIYIDTFNSEVVMGIYDGRGDELADVHTDNPRVKAIGNVTGIGLKKENGLFDFYDGIIIGNTAAKPDTTSKVELYYEATNFYDDINDYIFCTLEYMRQSSTSLSDYVVRIENTYYRTLDQAFRHAVSGNTIVLVKAIEQNGTNNNTNTIKLDLNGFTLSGTITNNGILTITGGQITPQRLGLETIPNTVINNGELYLGVNDNNIVYDEIVLTSDGVTLVNNGTLTMYDGTIRGVTALEGNTIIPPYYASVKKEEAGGYELIYLVETDYTVGTIYDYDYQGFEEVFVAPTSGYYELQSWGAQGGSYNDKYVGGYGAYSKGIIYLNQGDILYINVGGQGTLANNSTVPGGYNGGGSASTSDLNTYAGSGGGASSISTSSGLLKTQNSNNVLMVAAGGGGAFYNELYYSRGGDAGGIEGSLAPDGICGDNRNITTGTSATQTSGGSISSCTILNPPSYTASFGTGMDGTTNSAGGGAGYYGGGYGSSHGANGGSSYIGNSKIINLDGITKSMFAYKGLESTVDETRTISTTNVSSSPTRGTAKSGNGHIRITILSSEEDQNTHYVVVDPTKGFYNGTKDQSIFFLETGDQLLLSTATADSYFTFRDYTSNIEGTYNSSNKTVTMGTDNILITAEWDIDLSKVKAKIDEEYYITLQDAFNNAKNGDIIELLTDIDEDAINNSEYNITLDLKQNKITGSITNNGYLNLQNGIIENKNGIALTNNGTLNLGIDDRIIETDTIALISNDIALKDNGTFNFYDGYLEGNTTLDGQVDSIPKGYMIFNDRTNDILKIYLMLIPDSDNPGRAVASVVVNDMNMFFFNLQDAFNAGANNGATVYAIRNFDASYPITINTNKTVRFDLNGYTVNIGSNITNNGILQLLNTEETGELKPGSSFINRGTLIFNDIKVSATTNSSIIDNYGDIKLINTILTASQDGEVVYNYGSGSIISDNTSYLNAKDYSIHNVNLDEEGFTVEGGNLVGIYNEGIISLEEGTSIIKTWSTSESNQTIYNIGSNSKMIINGATIECINTSTYRVFAYGVLNDKNDPGEIIFNSGTITVKGTATNNNIYAQGLVNGIITMNNGTLNVSGRGYSTMGITGLNVTINGGTINLESTSTDAAAINNSNNSASITINNNPTITSTATCFRGNIIYNGGTSTCGVYGYNSYSYHTFEMYGGSIESVNNTINATSSYNVNISGGSLISKEARGVNYSAQNTNYKIAINSDNKNNQPTYIEGYTDGVYVNSSGLIRLKDATIIGKTNYGMYVKNSLNIGEKDGEVSITSPSIRGELVGLYINGGTTNFYDGIIKGAIPYQGTIKGVEEGYGITNGEEIIDGNTYPTIYLAEQVGFLRANGTTHNTLQSAIDAIDDVGIIEVIGDSDIKQISEIPSGKSIVLDLNGHTIHVTSQITNNGNFTIKDSKADTATKGKLTYDIQDLYNSNEQYELINNDGTMTISSGLFEGTSAFVKNTKTLTMDGGTITVTGTLYYTRGLKNSKENAVFTMNNGTIDVHNTASNYAIAIYNEYDNSAKQPKVTINNGIVKGTSHISSSRVHTIENGFVTVNGGTIEANGINVDDTYTFKNDGGTVTIVENKNSTNNPVIISNQTCYYVKKLTINGGTSTCGKYGYQSYYSKITMNGGTLTSEDITIYAQNYGQGIVITGGRIISNTKEAINYRTNHLTNQEYKLVINSDSMPTDEYTYIKGATSGIVLTNTYSSFIGASEIIGETSYGIHTKSELTIGVAGNDKKQYPKITGYTTGLYNEGSTVSLQEGTITGQTENGILTTGTLTIGQDDSNINVSYPLIIGEKIGLKIDNGATSFYDGILKGINKSYDGFISGIPAGYTLTDTEEIINYKTYKVSSFSRFQDFVKVGDLTFNNFKDAIDIISGTGTMEIIASVEVKEDFEIPIGKNVTLDLAGFNIIMSKSITNNGTFTLKDSKSTGGINYTSNRLINNYGTFILDSGRYAGAETFLYNEKTATINDGILTIEGTSKDISAFYNFKKDAVLTINDITLSVTSKYDDSNGNVYGIYNDYNTNNNQHPTNIINGGTYTIDGMYHTYTNANAIRYGEATVNGGIFTVNGTKEETAALYAYKLTLVENPDRITNPPEISSNNSCVRGELIMNAGKLENCRIGIYNSYNNQTINNGSVIATGNAIYAYYGYGINIHGGYFESTESQGIFYRGNYSTQKLSIDSDKMKDNGITTIKGKTIGIQMEGSTAANVINKSIIIGETSYGIITTRPINIGTSGNGLYIDYPSITGDTYALYINTSAETSPINIYDGIFKGKISPIYGAVASIENDTYLYEEEITENGNTYQIAYLKPLEDIIHNIDQDTKYNNLQTALDNTNAGDKLVLLDNLQIYNEIEIDSATRVTLDTAGYNIIASKKIINYGDITIEDSSSNTNNYIRNKVSIDFITNYKNLTIKNIKLIFDSTSYNVYPIINKNNGTTKLDNVDITSGYYGIKNESGGSLEYKNSTFISSNVGLYNYGAMSVDNVNISGTRYAVYLETTSNCSIDNSTITNTDNYPNSSSQTSIYKKDTTSLLTVNNTNIETGYLYNYGNMNITNGIIKSYIYNDVKEMNITGSNLTSINLPSTTTIDNKGTLTIDGITTNIEQNSSSNGQIINNVGTLTVKNSNILYKRNNNSNNNSYKHSRIIYSNKGSVTSINNTYELRDITIVDTRYASLYGIQNIDTSILNSSNDRIITYQGGDTYGIYNTNASTEQSISNINIQSNKGNNSTGLYIEKGTWSITGNNDIEINGITTSYGIKAETGTINLTNANIFTNATTSYGIYANNGKVNITDIYAHAKGSNAYGVYTNGSNAEIVLGIKDNGGIDADVSITRPFIYGQGSTIGLGAKKLNGKLKFYDGRIAGSTDSLQESPTETEPNHEVATYFDYTNNYYYNILEYMRSENSNIAASINTTTYTSIQLALNKAKTGDTVVVYQDVEETFAIPSDKTITLDLNNKTITGQVVNKGNSTIINGTITSPISPTLTNTGTLILGTKDSNVVEDNITIIGTSVAIKNEGYLYIYDGKYLATTPLDGPITNVESGYNYEITIDGDTNKLHLISGSLIEELDLIEGNIHNYAFDSTMLERTFTAPRNGYYKLQVWGAQGGAGLGNNRIYDRGGYGGYSEGIVYLHAGETLYINIGSKGENGRLDRYAQGGYNGGGIGTHDGKSGPSAPNDDDAAGGGGGATHIATTSGLLSSLSGNRNAILIAAGGGGGSSYSYNAGHGGGYMGGINTSTTSQLEVSQNTGYAFGQGANADGYIYEYGVGGGGGGYYGGYDNYVNGKPSGSGGSGYIGNIRLITTNIGEKAMYAYSGKTSTDYGTKTYSVNTASSLAIPKTAKEGDGYARIIELVEDVPMEINESRDYIVENVEQVFTAVQAGNYQIEAWGGQGGSSIIDGIKQDNNGGYGAYATGVIHLEAGTVLYINVGGRGEDGNLLNPSKGGYNGGGRGTNDSGGTSSSAATYNNASGGGGGATSVALTSGLLNSLNTASKKSTIILVAGGGGGASSNYEAGAGGGIKGGITPNTSQNNVTQSSGGSFGKGQDASGYADRTGVGGGGGGYFGGYANNAVGKSAGSGGSGYIGYALLNEKKMYTYNSFTSTDTATYTITTTNASNNPISTYAKLGEGHVRITYLG